MLHDVLAGRILRVRLAGDDDLNGQREQPLEVGVDEPRALVRREAAREADREAAGVDAAQSGEPLLEQGMYGPEGVGVETEHGVPAAVRGRCLGAYADRPQELGELGREPRAEMHSVRDVADRRVGARPQPRPHLAGHLAVQLRDAVGVGREAECQRRQAEAVRLPAATEPEQRLAGDAGIRREPAGVAEDELVAEHLVPGRDRCVRREDRRAPDLLERVATRQRPSQRGCALARS